MTDPHQSATSLGVDEGDIEGRALGIGTEQQRF